MVDGLLFDSFEMDPRVRFWVRFGASAEPILFANFLSRSLSSFGVCGRVFVACGVDALAKNHNWTNGEIIIRFQMEKLFSIRNIKLSV